jgi:CBS domain-containing protein
LVLVFSGRWTAGGQFAARWNRVISGAPRKGAVAVNATVKDVMTTHVVAVRVNAGYKEMAARLREFRVSAFPVLDDGNRVIGVVSEADLLAKEALEYSVPGLAGGILHGRERAKAAAVTAAELMTTPAVTIGPREPVSHAARLMYSRKLKRLPVVDDDGRLVGIVSRADLLSVFSRPAADIQRDIIENVIIGAVLTDPARFTVTVKDGVVTVEGKPENASTGRDMIEEIRHVEGVVAVRDRLSYPPEPRSAPHTDMNLDF